MPILTMALFLPRRMVAPYEGHQINKKLADFIKQHDFSRVVFHSLRHFSATIKLQISNGDIKAVQGDTGHAQARMVTDQYAHIIDGSRRDLAKQLDREFFQRTNLPASSVSPSQDDYMQTALQLLKANPDLAKLIAAMTLSPGM